MKKILVIDDDQALTQALKARLEAEHYEVTIAENGVEGLKAFESGTPDLVLLDVVMPQMDGYTFVRTLKAKGLANKVPLLVLSGRDATRDIFELEGIRDFLVKPCSVETLIQRIKEKLGSS